MANHDALRDVGLFVEVAKARSFTDAAMSLGVAARSLTRSMRRLEGVLGLSLIARSGRDAFVLTAQGEAFLPRASRLVAEAERAMAAPIDGSAAKPDPQAELDACSATILAELRTLNERLEARL